MCLVRILVAALVGGVLGWVAPGPFRDALVGVISSTADSLSWQAQTLTGWVTGPSSAATVAVAALVAALGVPAMVMAVAEVARSGQSARASATVVLIATALVALTATGVNTLPFAVAATLTAVVLAIVPGRWAVVPLSFALCAVGARWGADLLAERQWIHGPALDLAGVIGGPASVWLLVLAFVSLAPVVTGVRLLVQGPSRKKS